MKWKSIRGAGYYAENSYIEDDNGTRTAHKFLKNMVEKFAKKCKVFYDEVGDLPYAYGERQVHSAVFPAISEIADAAFAEQPIERKKRVGKRNKTSQGRIDYWVKYKNNVMLIELKHSWLSYKNAKPNESDNIATWNVLLEQLDDIKDKEALNLASKESNVVKIGLMIMPLYWNSKKLESLKPFTRKDADKMLKEIQNHMDYDWGCCWLAPEHISENQFWNSTEEVYTRCPGVVLLATVDNIGKGKYKE